MSYHIYTTDGIVLKRTPSGEANVYLHILTGDLGLIIASVQGVRQSSSKLNSALQDFSFSSVSCVKSKRGWKITDARPKENLFSFVSSEAKIVLARISSLLLQMIVGEQSQREIFETVLSGCQFLNSVSKNNIPDFECLIVLRIL